MIKDYNYCSATYEIMVLVLKYLRPIEERKILVLIRHLKLFNYQKAFFQDFFMLPLNL